MSFISKESLLLGAPYKIKDVCKVYQLTVNEIFREDEELAEKYYYYINLLTMEEEDMIEALEKKGFSIKDIGGKSVFEYLIDSASYDKTFLLDFKKALSTFIKEEILISFDNHMIIVGDPLKRKIIKEKEFAEIGTALRLFNKMRIKEPPPPDETPMQKRFRLKKEMRERVKEKQKSNDKDAPEFSDIMSSICTMNVGINLLNIGEYTIYQIKDQLERAQVNEKYHTELDMLMAGADSKKIKPEYYVRKIN